MKITFRLELLKRVSSSEKSVSAGPSGASNTDEEAFKKKLSRNEETLPTSKLKKLAPVGKWKCKSLPAIKLLEYISVQA